MTAGVLLQLTGPMQAWGRSSRFGQRDTERFPTRSGMIGMIAAALGRSRSAAITDLDGLRFAIRHDRPGRLLRDFHTVGGGLPRHATVPTAEGKRRSGNTTTVVSQRYYLADAAFTVAILSNGDAIEPIAAALLQPRWPLALGRRSCPAEGPFVIGVSDDPLTELETLPLARRAPERAHDVPIAVTFTADFPATAEAAVVSELADWPLSFAPGARAYRARPVYQWTLAMPPGQCGGLGAAYLDRLEHHQRAVAA